MPQSLGAIEQMAGLFIMWDELTAMKEGKKDQKGLNKMSKNSNIW